MYDVNKCQTIPSLYRLRIQIMHSDYAFRLCIQIMHSDYAFSVFFFLVLRTTCRLIFKKNKPHFNHWRNGELKNCSKQILCHHWYHHWYQLLFYLNFLCSAYFTFFQDRIELLITHMNFVLISCSIVISKML